MGFWRTALAALVGGLGVLLIAGLFRIAWTLYKVYFTAYGRLVTKTGSDLEKHLREAERKDRERNSRR